MTAIARSPSKSGKRGLPGGGATTGSTVTAEREPTLGAVRLPQTFRLRLALAVAAGLVVRLLYVGLFARKLALFGDAVTYHEWAQTIADGVGWVRVPHPELGLTHVTPVPSAEHPPLFSLVLAGFWKLGVHSSTAQKFVVCFMGASTVAFVGLAGREAGGERVGLIAAALAAVYPFLWVADGALLAESLYAAFMAAALWLALRFLRTRSLTDAGWVGLAGGAAPLLRGGGLLLGAPLLLPPPGEECPPQGPPGLLSRVWVPRW